MAKTCRTCHEPIEDPAKGCRNGCEQYTAMPIGAEYRNDYSMETAPDGQRIEVGGAAGNLRRMPSNRE